ncbi:MAG: hypothetical protein WBP22_03675 [Candidatus Saccharimonas sp.]
MSQQRARNFEVEQLDIGNPETTSFTDRLRLVDQANYAFRTNYNKPHDLERPIIHTYEHSGCSVTLISSSEQRITMQVVREGQVRTSYTYDSNERYPVTIDLYEDSESNEPTTTVALLGSIEHIPILRDMYAFIRDGTTDPN